MGRVTEGGDGKNVSITIIAGYFMFNSLCTNLRSSIKTLKPQLMLRGHAKEQLIVTLSDFLAAVSVRLEEEK